MELSLARFLLVVYANPDSAGIRVSHSTAKADNGVASVLFDAGRI
jgi:hypothetical protein